MSIDLDSSCPMKLSMDDVYNPNCELDTTLLESEDYDVFREEDNVSSSIDPAGSHYGSSPIHPTGRLIHFQDDFNEDSNQPSTGEQELDMMLDDDNPDRICHICGEEPCDWNTYGEELLEEGGKLFEHEEVITHSLVRKTIYRMYVYGKYGHLGKGKRVCIPVCVRDKIREQWPEESIKHYVGNLEE